MQVHIVGFHPAESFQVKSMFSKMFLQHGFLTVLLLSRIVEMTAEVLGVPYEFKKCDLMAGENMKVKDAVAVY